MTYDGRMHRSPEDVLATVQELIEAAQEEVVLSLPFHAYDAVRPELSSALDRDVFVLLLTHGDERGAGLPTFEECADVARWRPNRGGLFCITDKEWGLEGHRLVLERDESELHSVYRQATTVHNPVFAQALYGHFLADSWLVAEEVYTKPPADLPATYDNFRRAVVEATLFLREGAPLEVTATLRSRESGATRTTDAVVVNARQSVVSPVSSSFPTEHSLVVTMGEDRASVGGPGAFLEDYEGVEVTIERALDGDR